MVPAALAIGGGGKKKNLSKENGGNFLLCLLARAPLVSFSLLRFPRWVAVKVKSLLEDLLPESGVRILLLRVLSWFHGAPEVVTVVHQRRSAFGEVRRGAGSGWLGVCVSVIVASKCQVKRGLY